MNSQDVVEVEVDQKQLKSLRAHRRMVVLYSWSLAGVVALALCVIAVWAITGPGHSTLMISILALDAVAAGILIFALRDQRKELRQSVSSLAD